MKKTLIGAVVLVAGLAMTAMALPPVTVSEDCANIALLTGEYEAFMEVVDSDLDPAITDFEALTLVGEDWVWGKGLPDEWKLTLLGAALCVDTDLAADFAANQTTFLDGFVDALDALVVYGTGGAGSAQEKILAVGAAVTSLAGKPGASVETFGAFLDGALVGPYAPYAVYKPMIIAMVFDPTSVLSDDNDNGVFDFDDVDEDGEWDMLTEGTDELPGYLPYLCPALAAVIEEDIGAAGSTTQTFAIGMRYGFSNVFPALLALSTPSFEALDNFAENDLLADFREYATQFHLFNLVVGTAIAGYAQALGDMADAGALALGGAAFEAGGDAIDAIVLPELPILGVVAPLKADPIGEPFGEAGDYDGNGCTNLQTYNYIVAPTRGGGLAEFIAAASGTDPIAVPAAGLLGLAALVSAIAGGGAFVLRKK